MPRLYGEVLVSIGLFLAPTHGHAASGCDVIVCWAHNWPECPLEVVDLSKVMGRTG
ncbi:MAG TPA: hypothetical protein VKW06_14570 [Candidatus Angelobacter sp.]|nr:hypothetical protein [Candidatus Angelobacter sp.]